MNLAQQFLESGYAVMPADHSAPLERLRGEIFARAKEIFGHQGNDAASFFNQFHARDVRGAALNELRVKLIQDCNAGVDSAALIFAAFRETVVELLGPDLLVQKNTNLVIQQPGDPNPSEVHRDAPANSPYEIVVWVPLVDCYRSKCLYVCPRQVTEEALRLLDTTAKNDWAQFEQFCLQHGREPEVPFGSALLFWPGLFHGSRLNREQETRWSLNMRFKNLFSPAGLKEPFEFFKVLQLSPLAKLAIDFQKREVFG
jgi:sporadic carbohydrate cluster 2OG-Fe(II) oxygenase